MSAPREKVRRPLWPWLIVLVIVAALVVGAAFGAEAIARSTVETGVRALVASQLDLPPGEEAEVEVDGLVLPQLIAGTLDQITVAAPGVTLGPFTGDVSVTAHGVPIRGDAPASGGVASVRLDEQQLRTLLSEVDDLPVDTVAISAPNLTALRELSFLGVVIPISVVLAPGAANGALTLTPVSFDVGIAGASVGASADDLRSRFGGLADPVLRTYDVCIAGDLPRALTLTGVVVEQSQVIATFDVNGAVVVDRSLLSNGSCG